MEFEKFESAMERFANTVQKSSRIEKVAITQALGRILATDVAAPFSTPRRPTAAMDGYALNGADLSEGAKFKIVGTTPAGKMPGASAKAGECVKTFTGGLMCEGSDTLLPIENVQVQAGEIVVTKSVPAGFAVRAAGESYREGELLLRSGTKLGFSQIALLAELGLFHISVFVRPKVAILATGSEIKDLGERLENDAQIYSSNHIALANLVTQLGCEAMIMPIARDDEKELEGAILSALQSADILLTSGGVSVGDYDFVQSTLQSKFELIVKGAAIKPGRHVRVAKTGEKYIFAFPGFPLSALITCILFLRVYLQRSFGVHENTEFSAILDHDYVKKTPWLEFMPAVLQNREGRLFVSLQSKKQGSSAILNNLDDDSVLLVAPLEVKELKKGELVRVISVPKI